MIEKRYKPYSIETTGQLPDCPGCIRTQDPTRMVTHVSGTKQHPPTLADQLSKMIAERQEVLDKAANPDDWFSPSAIRSAREIIALAKWAKRVIEAYAETKNRDNQPTHFDGGVVLTSKVALLKQALSAPLEVEE